MERSEKYFFIQSIWACIAEACELDSDDSEKEDILLGLARLGKRATKLRVKKRTKRQWVKEWRKEKQTRGSYAFLNKELLVQDEASYRNYLRLTKPHFDILLSLIKDDIQRSDTLLREAIPAEEKLAVTLRFLATGESYTSLDYQSRLSKASISEMIPEVCSVLYERLKYTYLKFPNSDLEWEVIAKEFALKWQFPNCLGSLDGKHITFRPPQKDGAFFYNYKGTASIILLALVDANCKFIFVDVGCNGRCNDSGVFLRSKLSAVLEDDHNLPQASEIGRGRRLPYVIVADDAFPLQKHVMKPYPYHTTVPEKQVFNKRLSRARHTVEHAFGILCSRFRVLLAPMQLRVDTVQKIVLACCALHNFLYEMGDTPMEIAGSAEISTTPPTSDMPYNPRRGGAEDIRQEFVRYFNEEGMLDWCQSN